MVANISREKALKLAHPNHIKYNGYGTDTVTTTKVLTSLGYDFSFQFPKKLSEIKKLAIISLGWKTAPGKYHSVVWDPFAKKIYDPAYNSSLKHSLYEENMRWYVEVWKGKNK
jgi:hypothetical protein